CLSVPSDLLETCRKYSQNRRNESTKPRAGGASRDRDGRLEVEALEVGPEGVREIRVRQRKLDGGLQKAELVTGVVPLAGHLHGVHRPATTQRAQPIGQLDLAALVRRRFLEDREQVGCEHVPADDAEVGWRLLASWFLDQVVDLPDVAADVAAGDDAVLVDALGR